MILKRALYELSASEANEISGKKDVLSRQIVLETDPSRTIYISWTWGRDLEGSGRCYSLGYRAQSFFTDPAGKVIDVSNTSTWRPFIGNNLELGFVDDDFQILCVKNGACSIFCHTLEGNAIRIGAAYPRKNDAPLPV
jgi:hypothetical protein